MNPLRKQLIINHIANVAGVKDLPEFVYKFSVNQLNEMKELVGRAYNNGYEARGNENIPVPSSNPTQ